MKAILDLGVPPVRQVQAQVPRAALCVLRESLRQLLPLGRNELFENRVQPARDFPVRIILHEFREI